MRICHVTPHLPPDQAANALLPAQLGVWMEARGDEVAYVSQPPVQGGEAGRTAAGTVTWIPRRIRGGIARALRLDAPGIARAARRALDAAVRPGDALHLHSGGLLVETAARFARRGGHPHVMTLYGTEIWHYRPRWPIDPFTTAYRHAGCVTFYSRRLKERAIALGLDRPGLVVVYPPVDDRFAPRDEAVRDAWRRELGITERRVILNVKRLHPLAGQHVLLEAFARLAARGHDARLVVCGTGPLAGRLADRARDLRIAGRVTFTGLVPNDVVARYAGAADVFALPSLLEALPTVAVEALASGTPVVSADHPGGVELAEIFGDDVRVVPREDAAALADALDAALTEPRRTREATAQAIAAHFRPAAVLAAYDAAYAAATARAGAVS